MLSLQGSSSLKVAVDRPASPDDKIVLDGVVKQFGSGKRERITAVDRMTLRIPEGSFCMIVGPSGCGKTTVLRMLAGLEQPTAGHLEMRQPRTERPLLSMIFQGDSLFPWMTVWDNAAYGLRMRGVGQKEIKEAVGDYLSKIGLTKFSHCYPSQLSGGMRQRVGIARAFANDPDILLMDEPFSALDEQNKVLLQEELLRIWEETRKTVVFITHSVDEAVALGDAVVVMTAHPGRIKSIVPVDFPRPREILELRRTPEYGEVVFTIWEQLRDEVTAARQMEMDAS